MSIFSVELHVRKNGEDYRQITLFSDEKQARERFNQVLGVARVISEYEFTENKNLTDKLILYWQSKFILVKLFKVTEGEPETF
jgi:hypothetical protein